jgi:hypothetical protein
LETGVITISSLGVLAVAGFLSVANASAQAAGLSNQKQNASVIELYTSQGCSSCPEADQLLNQLAQRPDVIALSFPVSYWDYLGWKDTLARPENSERQRGYARILGDGEVFTPEVIVNGMQNCVGSNLADIEKAFKTTKPLVGKEAVPLSARLGGGRLIIDAGAAPSGSQHQKGKVWVASVLSALTVKITRGENAGNVVTYTNVVRDLTEAGEWSGAPISYDLPLNSLSKDGDMFVVFLQTEELGPIVGATRVAGRW